MIKCKYSQCLDEAIAIVDHDDMGMIMVCADHIETPNQTFRRLRNKFMSRNSYRRVPA